MGTWIVAGSKTIIKLTNSAFGAFSSTLEELIEKPEKKYGNNILELIEYLNQGGTLYVDLDKYFANSSEDLSDFLHLVKLTVQEFLKSSYWNNEDGKKILQKMVGNLEKYYDKIKSECDK